MHPGLVVLTEYQGTTTETFHTTASRARTTTESTTTTNTKIRSQNSFHSEFNTTFFKPTTTTAVAFRCVPVINISKIFQLFTFFAEVLQLLAGHN